MEEQTGGVKKNITLHLVEKLWNKNISSKESFIKGGEHIINKLKSQKKGLKNENKIK